MPAIQVDGLTFDFPGGWRLYKKYDEWNFYRNHFQKMFDGIKAMDLVVVDPGDCVWLIEVKDYRRHSRQKVSTLPEEVVMKARDTLAGLAAARVNANDPDEKGIAAAALSCSRIRVVLHLEQPARPSKLFQRHFILADVEQKLRQLVKPIDPHPMVLEMSDELRMAWTVK